MSSQYTPEQRFWNRAFKTNSCWLWLGPHGRSEYGGISYKGKQYKSHHLAYILTHGSRPDGLFILHTCDNPKCVNPDHLYAGTHADNMHDRKRRGRYGKNPCVATYQLQAELLARATEQVRRHAAARGISVSTAWRRVQSGEETLED